MHRAAAAEADQPKATRVMAAGDRDHTQCPHHGRVRHSQHCACGIRHPHPQRARDVTLDRPPGGRGVQPDTVAEGPVGVEMAEHDVGVRHRRTLAAEAVGGRAGAAPADSGPTDSVPKRSTAAIEPPPAPTESTSI